MPDKRKKLVVFTGAGMSAESGIPTFRGGDGLWENHRIEDVATPGAWQRNPSQVQEFYNQRRKKILESQPNRGHHILAAMEATFDVHIITQNIDDLHERAGSTYVLHLHGEITKSRSTAPPYTIYPIHGWQLDAGSRCPKGAPLRPHIVWFGEEVPLMEEALRITSAADLFAVVGTSLQVYPAASLVHEVSRGVPMYVVDPVVPEIADSSRITPIRAVASEGLEILRRLLSQ